MEIRNVLVIGSGTMGHGIAQVAAQAGYEARLFDVRPEAVRQGLDAVAANLAKGVDKGKVTAEERDAVLSRLDAAPGDLAVAAREADLVVEAVPEKIELKQAIFRTLGAEAPAHAILATNTSSLPVAAIAEASGAPERVLGLHFFNPVHIMQLLELVRTEATSPEVVDAARAAGERMGKTVIVVKDSPGFATSRLGLVLGLEAIRMVEEGVASAADIDTAMELGYRHPMGPLKLTDLVGLDVRLGIAEHLAKVLDDRRFDPPALLRKLVAEGKLGKKSGQGFYTW
ncbi:MAG: 3-hydroxyacyl-CoA dehydrogenase family protein [Planctomycetes bacterium]|nr:3-hydroxyacyl-CoA dehydrogenase family protein [Planctomycetota bacterium]MCB9824361.1 3-hydroxyacyl-CoA dehydrogenase family protein [Planctomycetota bacterium]MCB9828584.1 3-hydroxyacyl-CoA dehydrogenase family protein [Planctomycetota bacterium]MCB9900358.1 3-hydroxyacyl-CoA dehydrogenase family protein [Planctomycetota bacterium]